MSDVMLLGVLNMPYEMAMQDEMSRIQFHSRAQEAASVIKRLRKIEKIAKALVNEGHCDGPKPGYGYEMDGERALLCDATYYEELQRVLKGEEPFIFKDKEQPEK